MKIFLIRHAHAGNASENPERPLSKRGRRQVRTLARFLKHSSAFQPAELWQSPLARAQETTGLLALRLNLIANISTFPELETEAGIPVLAARLRKCRQSIALVGHEPHHSALASLLIAGAIKLPVCAMKKEAFFAPEKRIPLLGKVG